MAEVIGMSDDDKDRAAMLMRVAAAYIRKNAPNDVIHYDDADCDGRCLADDLESGASALTKVRAELL
jgi:hypothetical protein